MEVEGEDAEEEEEEEAGGGRRQEEVAQEEEGEELERDFIKDLKWKFAGCSTGQGRPMMRPKRSGGGSGVVAKEEW